MHILSQRDTCGERWFGPSCALSSAGENTVLPMSSGRAQAVSDCSIYSSRCNHMEKS